MDDMAADKNCKSPPIYDNLPKHADYVNFVPLKLNEPRDSCRLRDGSKENKDESSVIYCSRAAAQQDEETDVFASQEAAPETSQTGSWRLTSNKMFRDLSAADQAKVVQGQATRGERVSCTKTKEKQSQASETSTPKIKPPNGKNAPAHYTPLYGRRKSEHQCQPRTSTTTAVMAGDTSNSARSGTGYNGEGVSRAANINSPSVVRCLIIFLILVGLLSVEAMVLASLSIIRGTQVPGPTNQVSVVNNGSDVPNTTRVATNTTLDSGKRMLNLDTCQYKVKSSWSAKAEPAAANYVTLIEEKGFKILGVTCSTSGAQEYNLKSAMKGQKRAFICKCRGNSSLFTEERNKMKCFVHYWECKLT